MGRGRREREKARRDRGRESEKRQREEGERNRKQGRRRVKVWYLTQHKVNIYDLITVVSPQTHGQLYQLVNSYLSPTHTTVH